MYDCLVVGGFELLLCVCRYLHATTLKVLFLHSGAVIFLRVVESIDLDKEAPFSIKDFLREKEAHLWDVKLLLVFSGLLITCCCQKHALHVSML